MDEGVGHHEARRYAEAVAAFDRVLALEPGHREATQKKATSLRFAGRFDDAQAVIDGALAAQPDDAWFLNELGLLHFDQARWPEAAAAFDRALGQGGGDFSRRWKAASLRRAGRLAEAEAVLTEGPEERPASAELTGELGWIRFDQGLYEAAATAFDGALALAPGDDEWRRAKVTALRFDRRFDEALRMLDALLAAQPGDLWLLNELGLLELGRGRFDEAAAAFERALAVDATSPIALRSRVSALRLGRRLEEATQALAAALAQRPDDPEILYEEGLLAVDQDRLADADAAFAKGLRLAPTRVDMVFDRANLLLRLNRAAEAMELVDALARAQPESLEVINRLGWFHLNRSDPSGAEREFRRLPADHVWTQAGLGGVYFAERRYEDAVDCFRRVLAADHRDPAWHTNLAWALVRLEDDRRLDEAAALCQEAIRLDARRAQAYSCLGVIAFRRGHWRESEEAFLRSIAVSPLEGSHSDLGALYTQTGRYEEARRALDQALAVNPNDTQAHVELGNLHLEMENAREAVRAFRRAVALEPGNDDASRALALGLMRADDFAEAETVLRRALRRADPARRWRLHLTLSQLLSRRADRPGDVAQFYEEALREANTSLHLKEYAETYFQSGYVRAKLDDYRGALRMFERCLELDAENFEAERWVNRLRDLLRQRRVQTRGGVWGTILLGVLALVQLGVAWWFYFNQRISETTLAVLVPILLGLGVLAFLLPWLTKFKLPGLEAEMSQPKEAVSTGPTGVLASPGPMPTVSQGPR
jgi:tetratricopeptide (TPR) repeat protein